MLVSTQISPDRPDDTSVASRADLIELLAGAAPHPERGEELGLFGQFVGSWDMEVRFFDPTGASTAPARGVWTFGWVLDGRAIQDVLVMPGPDGVFTPGRRRIGSTLRYFHRELGKWRIVFLGTTTGVFVTLEGGALGDEIRLEGLDMDGGPLSWRFSEIRPDYFHWKGWKSPDDGRTWWLEQEMHARRIVEPLRASSGQDA